MTVVKKSHTAALVAVGLLTGVFLTVAGSATEYEEIGNVAEGVYLVTGDDNRFRLSAVDDVKVLVYGAEGDLILARTMDAGKDRSFALDDGAAIVAVLGGEATVEAAGPGHIERVGVDHKRVPLVSADGGPVRENVTVQLPPFLVGVSGTLAGEAHGIEVLATTDEGTVFHATDEELLSINDDLAVEALDAQVIDVRIRAEHLDGTLVMLFAQPSVKALKHLTGEMPVRHEAHDEVEDVDDEFEFFGIEIDELAHTPVRFTTDADSVLTFDVEEGHILDASIYDEDNAQFAYVHLGEDIVSARSHCDSLETCFARWSMDHERVVAETVEVALPAGTYLLYIREAHVDGVLYLEAADGAFLAPRIDILELDRVEIAPGQSVEMDTPLLDLWADSWNPDAFEEMRVIVGEETVFSYAATLNLFGAKADSNTTYLPELLGPGPVLFEASGTAGEVWGGKYVSLYTIE